MKRIRKFNETNGPAYGKQETTKKGLKGIPLTTENPTIIEEEPFDDSIPNEDNTLEDDDNEIRIIKQLKKPNKNKRLKNFKEVTESNSILKTKELYNGEHSENLENLDELIDLYTKKVELLKKHRKGLIQKLSEKE